MLTCDQAFCGSRRAARKSAPPVRPCEDCRERAGPGKSVGEWRYSKGSAYILHKSLSAGPVADERHWSGLSTVSHNADVLSGCGVVLREAAVADPVGEAHQAKVLGLHGAPPVSVLPSLMGAGTALLDQVAERCGIRRGDARADQGFKAAVIFQGRWRTSSSRWPGATPPPGPGASFGNRSGGRSNWQWQPPPSSGASPATTTTGSATAPPALHRRHASAVSAAVNLPTWQPSCTFACGWGRTGRCWYNALAGHHTDGVRQSGADSPSRR